METLRFEISFRNRGRKLVSFPTDTSKAPWGEPAENVCGVSALNGSETSSDFHLKHKMFFRNQYPENCSPLYTCEQYTFLLSVTRTSVSNYHCLRVQKRNVLRVKTASSHCV